MHWSGFEARKSTGLIAVALSVLWIVAVLPGCGNAKSCDKDGDCFKGQVCENGVCAEDQGGGGTDADDAGGDAPVSDVQDDEDTGLADVAVDGSVSDEDTSTSDAPTGGDGCLAEEMNCDGKDDDCDGMTDEDLEKKCPNQEGVCKGASVSCSGGKFPSCNASVYKKHDEDYEQKEISQDQDDNDCDGRVDNVPFTALFGTSGRDSLGRPSTAYGSFGGQAGIDPKSGSIFVLFREGTLTGELYVEEFETTGSNAGRTTLAYNAYPYIGMDVAGDSLYAAWTREYQNDKRGRGKRRSLRMPTLYWKTGNLMGNPSGNVQVNDVAVDRGNKSVYYAGIDVEGGGSAITPFVMKYHDDLMMSSCIMSSSNTCRASSWPKHPQIGEVEAVRAVAVDDQTNAIYVVGRAKGDMDIKGKKNNPGGHSVFLVKYDASGNVQWGEWIGSADNQYVSDVAVYPNKKAVLVVGRTQGKIGKQSFNGGTTDAFLAAFDTQGSMKWIDVAGTSGGDEYKGIAVRERDGAIFVTGNSEGKFGGNSPSGNSDIATAKYDTSGNIQSSWLEGTSKGDFGHDVVVDPKTDDVYLVGETEGNFGCAQCLKGVTDIFIERMKVK